MQKEILFSQGLAAEVRRRVDLFSKHQAELNIWLDTVMTVAAEQGGAESRKVAMNEAMTGVVVVDDAPQGDAPQAGAEPPKKTKNN